MVGREREGVGERERERGKVRGEVYQSTHYTNVTLRNGLRNCVSKEFTGID